MEIKICKNCGGGFPATSEFFLPDKRCASGLRSQCRECKRLEMKRYTRTKDCKTTFLRWQKTNSDLHIECFYAIRYSVKRFYRHMNDRITNKEHWEHEKGTKNLFTDFDQFFSHLVFDLGFDNSKEFGDVEVYRIDSNKDYQANNIQLITAFEYYESVKFDRSLPPVKVCTLCSKKFYKFGESTRCQICVRISDKEYDRAFRKKRKKRTPVEKYLYELYEWCRPISKKFLFRLPNRLVLLKFFNANEFVEHCKGILANKDPKELRLDLIDYTGHIESGNLEFLTSEEFTAKHEEKK